MRGHPLACAVNLSEGRDPGVLAEFRSAAGDRLADLHADRDHHRCVVTLVGRADDLVAAAARLAVAAIESIDLGQHAGVHPRIGAIDVVPFAPLDVRHLPEAIAAREAALVELGALGLPCFRYGPLDGGGVRTLPEVRRGAFVSLSPDSGPTSRHPTAGAVAVGARGPLVAWNLWLSGASLAQTRAIAASIRSPSLRALGLPVAGGTQVSCNLVEPDVVTPLDVYDLVADALPAGARIERCELVGLAPAAVLESIPEPRWPTLDLSAQRTFEAALVRLDARRADG